MTADILLNRENKLVTTSRRSDSDQIRCQAIRDMDEKKKVVREILLGEIDKRTW